MDSKEDNLLSELKTGVILLDGSLRVEYLNASVESMLDISAKASLKKPLSSLFYEEPDNLERFKSCLANSESFLKLDALLILRGNKKLLCNYEVHPLSKLGQKNGLLIEINNKEYSTEIKERLRRQTNQKITSEFIRGLAHEIKNPLSGIRGAAQLLSQKLPEGHLNEYTNIIINQTDRLSSLVDNMLGPRRKPSFKFENIHIPIESVCTLIRQELKDEGITVFKDFDPSIPELSIDSYLLEQGILNLVRNAKESLVESATLSPKIEIITRVLHNAFIGDVKKSTVCKISIKDNGPGIPDKIKESIFFPMISGKEGGTGLGLSITQGIISQHKGTVQFKSSHGETDFSILMPIEKNKTQFNKLRIVNG